MHATLDMPAGSSRLSQPQVMHIHEGGSSDKTPLMLAVSACCLNTVSQAIMLDCSTEYSSPKSVSLDQVAALLINNQSAGDKCWVEVQAICGTPHALQILQHVLESFTLPGIHIVMNQGVIHVVPCKPKALCERFDNKQPQQQQPQQQLQQLTGRYLNSMAAQATIQSLLACVYLQLNDTVHNTYSLNGAQIQCSTAENGTISSALGVLRRHLESLHKCLQGSTLSVLLQMHVGSVTKLLSSTTKHLL